jgi:tRNA 2-selenouridine synthase
MLADALSTQRLSGAVDGHRLWIELLLREYYDPMYTHQKASKAGRIIAAGDADKLHGFLLK